MSELTDLLERFRRGPELLAVVMTGVYGEEEDFVPSAGSWSIRQIMAHMADSELVAAYRLRSVIAEDDPALRGYDQDRWAANLDYARRKPAKSLETFRRMRAENHELLKELPEPAFDRAGMHSEHGRQTLRQLLATYSEHAESHARQVQGIRDEYKKSKGRK